MKIEDAPRRILLIEEPTQNTLGPKLGRKDDPAIQVVPDLRAAYACLAQHEFEVIVVSARENEQQSTDISLLIQTRPETPVVVVGEENIEEFALTMLRAGAQDFVVRGQCEGEILDRTLRYAIERHRLQRELRDLSLRDELTGLYNRRGFLTLGNPHILAANRLQIDMGVLYFDLDNLKRINDDQGHAAGDEALKRAAQLLKRTLRTTDTLARIGGDEFAALALGATPRGEASLLSRIRRNLDAHNFQNPELPPVSLSIGIAFYLAEAPQTLETLLEDADAKMYIEKKERKAVIARG